MCSAAAEQALGSGFPEGVRHGLSRGHRSSLCHRFIKQLVVELVPDGL
jgi:hypothetical protein